jgi:ribosomal protein S18 acetylase RimI-like enzyme
MKIKIIKDKKEHNWKKIHKRIVKDTSYEFLGDFTDNTKDITNYYCYEKETNKPIGYLSLGFSTEYHRFYGINFIGILPEYRRKGIASKLLFFAKKHAKKEGYLRLFTVYSTSESNVFNFNRKHCFSSESTYVNILLDSGKRLYFCPFSYYDKNLKEKSSLLHTFKIMFLRL